MKAARFGTFLRKALQLLFGVQDQQLASLSEIKRKLDELVDGVVDRFGVQLKAELQQLRNELCCTDGLNTGELGAINARLSVLMDHAAKQYELAQRAFELIETQEAERKARVLRQLTAWRSMMATAPLNDEVKAQLLQLADSLAKDLQP